VQEEKKSTEELLRQLTPESLRQVRSLAESLIARQEARPRRQPHFDWAGALSEMRNQYSSVDLQHQLLNWRSELE
jgi:hypothetical protein